MPAVCHMPKKKPQPAETPRERIDLRCEAEWVARLTVQARRRGLTVSAYIRQAVTKEIEADEATDPKRQ
jgi:predicted DNA-binding protein